MKKIIKMLLISFVAATMLTACSDPPTAKVTEAKSLIESVITAGGEQSAPLLVASIQKRYTEALAELELQNKATFKNYNMAIFTLDQLMDDCDQIKANIAKDRGEAVVAMVKRSQPFVNQ